MTIPQTKTEKLKSFSDNIKVHHKQACGI